MANHANTTQPYTYIYTVNDDDDHPPRMMVTVNCIHCPTKPGTHTDTHGALSLLGFSADGAAGEVYNALWTFAQGKVCMCVRLLLLDTSFIRWILETSRCLPREMLRFLGYAIPTTQGTGLDGFWWLSVNITIHLAVCRPGSTEASRFCPVVRLDKSTSTAIAARDRGCTRAHCAGVIVVLGAGHTAQTVCTPLVRPILRLIA